MAAAPPISPQPTLIGPVVSRPANNMTHMTAFKEGSVEVQLCESAENSLTTTFVILVLLLLYMKKKKNPPTEIQRAEMFLLMSSFIPPPCFPLILQGCQNDVSQICLNGLLAAAEQASGRCGVWLQSQPTWVHKRKVNNKYLYATPCRGGRVKVWMRFFRNVSPPCR